MPRTIRDDLKHNCARAIKHLLTTAEYISETRKIFENTHPEQVNDLDELTIFVGASIEGLSMFMYKVWGIDKDNIHKWF